MNEMVKKALAGALVLGVAGVWVPQLMSASTDSKPKAPEEVAADGAGLDLTKWSVLEHVENDAAQVPEGDSTSLDGTNRRPVERIPLESAVARAQSLIAGTRSLDVPVAPPPDRTSDDGPDGAHAAPTPEAGAIVLDTPPPVTNTLPSERELPRGGEVDPVAQFVATHPLQGTVVGASDRVATLGPVVARIGDEVSPGIVVAAIEPRYVDLRASDARQNTRTVRVELQPFRARAATSPTGSRGGAGAGSGDNGGGANDSGGSPAGAPPAGGAAPAGGATPATSGGAGADSGAGASNNAGGASSANTNSGNRQ